MSAKKPYFRIPHKAYVFVGDGCKALFLRNDGSEIAVDLTVDRVFETENPPTHEQGTDKPGRAIFSIAARRSTMDQVDWHDIEAHRFARDVAGAFERLLREHAVPAIIVVAPPRTLADLRRTFHADVQAKIIAEIAKDFTGLPIHEIAQHLSQ
jgi:protein required for attachment to host cells